MLIIIYYYATKATTEIHAYI